MHLLVQSIGRGVPIGLVQAALQALQTDIDRVVKDRSGSEIRGLERTISNLGRDRRRRRPTSRV